MICFYLEFFSMKILFGSFSTILVRITLCSLIRNCCDLLWKWCWRLYLRWLVSINLVLVFFGFFFLFFYFLLLVEYFNTNSPQCLCFPFSNYEKTFYWLAFINFTLSLANIYSQILFRTCQFWHIIRQFKFSNFGFLMTIYEISVFLLGVQNW